MLVVLQGLPNLHSHIQVRFCFRNFSWENEPGPSLMARAFRARHPLCSPLRSPCLYTQHANTPRLLRACTIDICLTSNL